MEQMTIDGTGPWLILLLVLILFDISTRRRGAFGLRIPFVDDPDRSSFRYRRP